MACMDIGKLRAYCDGELASHEAKKLESHVPECAQCREQLDDIRQNARLLSSKISALTPRKVEPTLSDETSLAMIKAKLTARHEERHILGRFRGLFTGTSYQWRAAAASLATVAMIVALVVLPPVQSMANDLLGVFRVQKFTPVTVEPEKLSNLPMLDPTMMGTFEGISKGPSVYSGLSHSEAAAKLDFPVRLPEQLPSTISKEAQLTVMDDFAFSYTFDLSKAEAYLASLGLKGISLPKSPDGQKMSAAIPARLFVEYRGSGSASPRLMLVEGKSPVLEIPDAVNTEEVRNAILSFPGLPAELVVQLRALDWMTTAPVPVMKGDTSRQVTVDGVEGLLIKSEYQKLSVILWQKQDVVYALGGQVSDTDLIAAANSMR